MRSLEPTVVEPIKTAEDVWSELDPHSRERALRLLSDLCYAYVTKQIGESSAGSDAKEEPAESFEQSN